MKLSDIDVAEVIAALRQERSSWIDVAHDEGRRNTEAEKLTICILAAFERTFTKAVGNTTDRNN